MEDGPWRCVPPTNNFPDAAQCVCRYRCADFYMHSHSHGLCRARVFVAREQRCPLDSDVVALCFLWKYGRLLVGTIVQDDGRQVVAKEYALDCSLVPRPCVYRLLCCELVCLVSWFKWCRAIPYDVLVDSALVLHFRSFGESMSSFAFKGRI
jgi:hypothetical protein